MGHWSAGGVGPSTPGIPEIDRANANLQLGGTLRPVKCTGEDKVTINGVVEPTPYVTYMGSWKGGQSQVLPDPTDYSLSGTVTVSAIKWTINLNTLRGVLTGKYVLTGPTGAAPTFSGTVVVVTQGNPVAGAAPTVGRGYIVSNSLLPDDGVAPPPPNDDWLVANVEFPSLNVGGATGYFGDLAGAPKIPDFSVVTNTPPRGGPGLLAGPSIS